MSIWNIFGGQKVAYADYFQAYLDAYVSYSKKTPLEEVRFVVLDTETTGLDSKKDRILSLAAVSLQGQQMNLADSFQRLFNQEKLPEKDSIAVHGILPRDVQWGTEEADGLQDFLSYLGSAIIVGQHIGFDLAILRAALERHGGGKLKNQFVDTSKLAYRVDHALRSQIPVNQQLYSLDALCERYQIEPRFRHTAPGDTYITAILFMKLLGKLRQRGMRTVGDLLR